jgi:hypothetical protein
VAGEDLVAIWISHAKVPAALIIKDVPTWNFGLPCRRRGKNPRGWENVAQGSLSSPPILMAGGFSTAPWF